MKHKTKLTCARLQTGDGMINLIGKGIRVAGAEIQLAHSDVVLILVLAVGIHHVVCFACLAGGRENRLFLRGIIRKEKKRERKGRGEAMIDRASIKGALRVLKRHRDETTQQGRTGRGEKDPGWPNAKFSVVRCRSPLLCVKASTWVLISRAVKSETGSRRDHERG